MSQKLGHILPLLVIFLDFHGIYFLLYYSLLCDDDFQSPTPLVEVDCHQDISSKMAMDIGCMNRKFKCW